MVVTVGLVTKWSRIVSDCISEDVVNPPSSRFFQPRHNVRIRIDGEGYGGVSERIVAEEADLPADSIFPVDAKWALEWDEVEEDSETAGCLREHPEECMSRRS